MTSKNCLPDRSFRLYFDVSRFTNAIDFGGDGWLRPSKQRAHVQVQVRSVDNAVVVMVVVGGGRGGGSFHDLRRPHVPPYSLLSFCLAISVDSSPCPRASPISCAASSSSPPGRATFEDDFGDSPGLGDDGHHGTHDNNAPTARQRRDDDSRPRCGAFDEMDDTEDLQWLSHCR
jgi:hypothetical protein